MIPGIPNEALTPLGAIFFTQIVITLVVLFGVFVPRWVLTRLVNAANKRADDFEKLYTIERARGDIQQGINQKLTTIAETNAKILEGLPRLGDSEKVSP
jgi:hypothetical protein